MADRRASLEGVTSRTRHRSPTSEAHPAHHESLATGSGTASRRRPIRHKANSHDSSHHTSSICVDTAKAESRKAKRGSASPTTDDNTASSRSSSEESEEEGELDTVESLPTLNQISEGKESKTFKRRGGSTSNSTTDQSRAFRRRRSAEDGILGRRSARPNRGSSSQKRAETLGKLPNPSLVSILSELTQQSNASNESNTTITQKSYDDKSYISKQKAARGKNREQTKSTPAKKVTMESPQSNVFEFLNEGLSSEQFLNGVPHDGRPMTSSSTSSSATSHETESDDEEEEEEDSSSDTEETVADTPMTSPTSTRRSDSDRSRYHEGIGVNAGVPVHQNGAGARPARVSQSEHYEVEYAESEDGEEGELSEEESDEEDDGDGSAYATDHGHTQHLALERAPPARIPSATSSQRSDPHTRRLRRQEQELANHILQSPQPHREFQFIGGPSPHPYPAMPMYDNYPHSGSSPSQQALGWHPPPPVPPPPPIGYNPPPHAPLAPYSPDNGNRFQMASHSPVAAPNMAVRVSPYHHTAVHPPQYQAQPPGPDLSRSTVAGYELVADKLSEPAKNDSKASTTDKVVPMYRKFESLNHRVLLHLQDEICELEEELRILDEYIVQSSPRDEVGRVHPASRRGDARFGGELHHRRTELLGRIYLKLGQYNQALSSFSNLVKTLEPAGTEDIQAYQAWMEKRAPIDYNESRFLDRKDDLLTVSRRRGSNVSRVVPRQSAAVGLPLILVFPLMAFAIVPGLLGRLFIIVVIGCIEVRLVMTTPELIEFMRMDEWIKCGSIYFGVMALLAALVR